MISKNDVLINKILEMRELFSDTMETVIPTEESSFITTGLTENMATYLMDWLEELEEIEPEKAEAYRNQLMEFKEGLEALLYLKGKPKKVLVKTDDVYQDQAHPPAAGIPKFNNSAIGDIKHYKLSKQSAQHNLMQIFTFAMQKLIKHSLIYKHPDIRPHDAVPGDRTYILKFLNEHENIALYLAQNIKKLDHLNSEFLKYREKKRSAPKSSQEVKMQKAVQATEHLKIARQQLIQSLTESIAETNKQIKLLNRITEFDSENNLNKHIAQLDLLKNQKSKLKSRLAEIAMLEDNEFEMSDSEDEEHGEEVKLSREAESSDSKSEEEVEPEKVTVVDKKVMIESLHTLQTLTVNKYKTLLELVNTTKTTIDPFIKENMERYETIQQSSTELLDKLSKDPNKIINKNNIDYETLVNNLELSNDIIDNLNKHIMSLLSSVFPVTFSSKDTVPLNKGSAQAKSEDHPTQDKPKNKP